MRDPAGTAKPGVEPADRQICCAPCGDSAYVRWGDRFRIARDGHVEHPVRARGSTRNAALLRLPGRTTWSALEYVRHLADVFELYHLQGPVSEVRDYACDMRKHGQNDSAAAKTMDRLHRAASAIADTAHHLRPGDIDRAGHCAGEPRTIRQVIYHVVHEAAPHDINARRLLAVADPAGRR
jgi:hypothetical protein